MFRSPRPDERKDEYMTDEWMNGWMTDGWLMNGCSWMENWIELNSYWNDPTRTVLYWIENKPRDEVTNAPDMIRRVVWLIRFNWQCDGLSWVELSWEWNYCGVLFPLCIRKRVYVMSLSWINQSVLLPVIRFPKRSHFFIGKIGLWV